MKKLVVGFCVAVAVQSVLAQMTVSDVIVRQQWPWKSTVSVDFLVSGAGSGIGEVSLAAYAGEEFLGYIPPTACEGETIVRENGLKRITFEPGEIPFLCNRGTMADFRLDVVANGVPAEEVLYLIFDLTKTANEVGALTYVTEFDLTNGVWGAWSRGQWGFVDTPIWTDVTQDDKYRTTHLVMRRIPGGSFTYGTDPGAAAIWHENDISRTTVTISKDYYLAVFEMTEAQCKRIWDRTDASGSMKPQCYKKFKGATADGKIWRSYTSADYDWPGGTQFWGNSILGRLRSRTGLDFDLPTEAQWEKAARGGSPGVYYSTGGAEPDAAMLRQIAWTRSASSSSDWCMHEVGKKLPNDYGLYDILGNAQEYVLDRFQAGYVPDATDPAGPTTGDNRVLKGYCWSGWTKLGDNPSILNIVHIGGREYVSETAEGGTATCRACCPDPF